MVSKAQSLSARETKRYIERVRKYGIWCYNKDPNMSFETACSMEAFQTYDNLQMIVEAYFLLTPVAFRAAWGKGFNSRKADCNPSLF